MAPSITNLTAKSDPDLTPELTHFHTLPLSRPTLLDPNFHPIPASRTLTHNGHGHTLMASTWNTSLTIPRMLTLCRPSPLSADSGTASSSKQPNAEQPPPRAEVRRFYTFGSGLNAHADLLHGGVIACILDSTMGNIAALTMHETFKDLDQNGDRFSDREGPPNMFTAQLNVRYDKPVRTPGTVMVKAWVRDGGVKGEGRKVWVCGEVASGSEGEVCHARGEGLWVRPSHRVRQGRGKL